MSSVLDPKVVLVTGASSGIGRATALALSKAGAAVAVGGRRTDRLEALAQEAPGEILVLDMDVSDPESVRKAVDRTVERFGTLGHLLGPSCPVLAHDTACPSHPTTPFRS
ncbi:SDR family NAD(P)-dependent oxidoreductase [Streptomyces sp. NPDC047453]|uniref:SDR family oxidoreductase n=1 Tax=Streptomyces sp. NPDC047453 TaxID=3154812 RepID=UPI00340AD8C9